MTAASALISNPSNNNLRPIEPHRDLAAVADLVELSFKDRLDQDGYRYVRQMRRAAQNEGLFAAAATRPLKGFIWEEDGQIVGNLNMLPVFAAGQRAYLIANVAVHPTHRRQGIARQLTDAALEFVKQRSVRYAWLQVDADNPVAIELYTNKGFIEQARRTTWHTTHNSIPEPPANIRVSSRRGGDWEKQKSWLSENYPYPIRWHLALSPKLFRPGISGLLSRAFSDKTLRQWSAYKSGKLIGSLTWQSSNSQADWLWLAAPPENDGDAIQSLTTHARRGLSPSRTLAINFPAGRAVDILQNTGFKSHQTLIWMKIDLEQ